ncbi:MAG: TIR domain-containing protein [bacterium]|nr:TIR domain-containing protein [bacterium]
MCYITKASQVVRIGEDLYREINDAIRVRDKVVLLISEHSLKSPTVDREIERALQEEDQQAVPPASDPGPL